jgi:hypothetical protein
MTRDLPDDMIDAEPAGAWTSDDVADGQTADSSADAMRDVQEESPDQELSSADGVPAPDGEPADGSERAADPVDATEGASDPFVESAEIQQGLDPDLTTDDQTRR